MSIAYFLISLNQKHLNYKPISQLSMLEASNKEIIEHVMIIDEANNLQEDLVSNNIGNDGPRKHVECEGMITHKDSLLKHAMSRTACPKSFDRIKRAADLVSTRMIALAW